MPQLYDPRAPGFFADPYPQYARIQAENPTHETRIGFLLMARYRDVVSAYRTPALSRDMRLWRDFTRWRRGRADGPLERMMENWLVMVDPPRHTPLRAIHERVFSPRLFAACRPLLDGIVAELLAGGRARGGFDLVADFAEPIAVFLVNGLLGLPRADWPAFVEWSRAIARTTEPLLSTEVLAAGERARQAMADYLVPLSRQRRRTPGDDVLSGLARTEVDGVRLTEEQLTDSLIFLYQAGHPTGAQLIALAVHSLLRHPDQLARLRTDPALLPGAVEELQRFDGPVQMNDRVATEDVRLGGVEVGKGQLVRLCIAAANRDPDRYSDPHRLDVTRTVTGQLGYGHGLHSCVAAELGRAQARAALGALLDRAGELRPAGDPVFLRSMSNRGLATLPVQF